MKVMVIVKASAASEAGEMPSAEMFAAMDKFNEELINAGIMLDGTGLTPSSRGARVRFSGSNRIVTDGPFPETKELIAGFSIWKVSSLQEAIDWVKKCPNPMIEDSDVEIRPLMEPEDFAGVVTPERLEEVKELEARSGDRDGYGLARFK
ncbi:MAG: YciI family protein [Isosphaeraceae bacterium]